MHVTYSLLRSLAPELKWVPYQPSSGEIIQILPANSTINIESQRSGWENPDFEDLLSWTMSQGSNFCQFDKIYLKIYFPRTI